MKILLIVVMILAAGVMLWGLAQQKKGVAAGKIFAVLGAEVALLCALGTAFTGGGVSPERAMEVHLAYTRVATEKLGLQLKEKAPAAKVLLLVGPRFAEGDKMTDALAAGLEKGLGAKVEQMELKPELPPAMAPAGAEAPPVDLAMLPPEVWFTAAAMDKALDAATGKYEVVVSCLGLPMDFKAMHFWQKPNRPKLALAQGDIYQLRPAIEDGTIVAAVTANPKAEYDQSRPPSNLEAAFAKRFILVTTENVKEIVAQYPDLFLQTP
jgi:hypothetical protein